MLFGWCTITVISGHLGYSAGGSCDLTMPNFCITLPSPATAHWLQAVCHNGLRRIILPQVQVHGELVDFKNELSWYVHCKQRAGNVGGGEMEEEEEKEEEKEKEKEGEAEE